MCAIEIERVVSTERLTLRRPRLADAAQIADYCADPGVSRMTARIPYPYTRQHAEGFLAHVEAQPACAEPTWAIEAEGGLIGLLGFLQNEEGRLEMGYWLGRPHWGRGYATEAVRAALSWAGRDWARRYVMAGHFADNPASGVVLVKAGFLYTGEVRLLRSEARGGEVPARTMVWLA